MAAPRIYTWSDYLGALRRSRSVQIIVGLFTLLSVTDGAIAFVRTGTGVNFEDLKKALNGIPGNPWTWFFSIGCLALSALLIAILHETKQIVQSKMTEHQSEIATLESAHSSALNTEKNNNANAVQQLKNDNETAKLTYDHRIKTLEIQLEAMRDKRPKVRLGYGSLNGGIPEFWLENFGNRDAYDTNVFMRYEHSSVVWSGPVGCLPPEKKQPLFFTIDGESGSMESFLRAKSDGQQEASATLSIGYRDPDHEHWSTACTLNCDTVSGKLSVTCNEPMLLAPMPRLQGSY